jgi:hypothetical protein
MEVREADAPGKVLIDLNFIEPFPSQNTAEFTITEQASASHVNWEMQGPMSFFLKFMAPIMSFEKMVGPSFEKGLAKMKEVAEQT